MGRAGTQTAALGFAGIVAGSPSKTAVTLKYDGSSWTAVNSMNTARSDLGGTGSQAAALAFGGETSDSAVETWDGTNWATTSSLASPRKYLGSGGFAPNTASIAFGGVAPGGGLTGINATEEFTSVATLKVITDS